MSSMTPNWRNAVLPINATIEQAIFNLNEFGLKIILVVNEVGTFLGTISDGDIRRGLLKGLGLNSSIESIVHHNALVVTGNIGIDLVKQIMTVNKIHQIPIVNEMHVLEGLHLWDVIASPPSRSNLMVIMAGGLGTRLRPFTEDCPKPLLSVHGKPILEHIIQQAKVDGFKKFFISVNYLGHMIEDYFGDGSRLSVEIDYLRESVPLGTAGALGFLDSNSNVPVVVTNGDVITDISYGELLDFHVRNCAMATMAVRMHEWQHPFGVVQTQGIEIIGFEEKPINRSHINAGVYVLDSSVLSLIKPGEVSDMPTVFEKARDKAMKTIVYPMHEPWLDIGRPDDFFAANSI